MRRKEKRLLQAVALVLAALVLLPNVGLWALYRERQPDSTPGGSGAAAPPAAGQVSPLGAVGLGTRSPNSLLAFGCVLSLSLPASSQSAGDFSVLPIFLDGTVEAQKRTGTHSGPRAHQRQTENKKPGLLIPSLEVCFLPVTILLSVPICCHLTSSPTSRF